MQIRIAQQLIAMLHLFQMKLQQKFIYNNRNRKAIVL